MKRLVYIILCLMLSGCVVEAPKNICQRSEEVCSNNSGVQSIKIRYIFFFGSISDGAYVRCNNGALFWIDSDSMVSHEKD